MIDSIAVSRALSELGGTGSFSYDVSDELNEDWYASVVWSGAGTPLSRRQQRRGFGEFSLSRPKTALRGGLGRGGEAPVQGLPGL